MSAPPVLDARETRLLEPVLQALDGGLVVAVPTDTVYGLVARLDRPAGVAAIFEAKQRPADLALPVLVGRWRQARGVAARWPRSASMVAARFWPGALTVVVPAAPGLGTLLGSTRSTVGLRHPAHRLVTDLCRQAGPLASTSANLHGKPPCTTAAQVAAAFDVDAVALVVDGGTCNGAPSTVVDCTVTPPDCLREGAVPWAWVEASLR